MNKKILIAYANEPMKYSLTYMRLQGLFCRVFDKIVLYSEKNLPTEITCNPLFSYKRGGGYWVWKPYIIWKTLQDNDENDVICYIDCGCKIKKGDEWEKYFSYMNKYDTLCFQYSEFIPKWEATFNCGQSNIKFWSKRQTLDFFSESFKSNDFYNFGKISGGFIFAKGQSNQLIKDWLDITLQHYELILDPKDDEEQYSFFSGLHRHDQSILTPLVWKYNNSKTVKVLPEIYDENAISSIIRASRLRIFSKRQLIKEIVKRLFSHDIFKISYSILA